ncbi:uncharacterized protein BDV17DRAFT_498 [Aspergillus undulatus]|uniref:uncharacterized protein n=1 Tax=Aspergillus undulatus TaxID=1810928 RepID=UPI003CCCFE2F
MRNIFVSKDDPSKIAAVIDWQSASIEQHFGTQTRFQTLQRATISALKLSILRRSITHSSYPVQRLMDESFFRPSCYSHQTWRNGAVALRQELIDVARLWEQLGLQGQCPNSPPTGDELLKHEKEYNLSVAARNLKPDLAGLLNCVTGGWTTPDR